MTRVKVCGVMNAADAAICASLGAHAVGFVVEYPEPVPWNLSAAEAAPLAAGLPPFTCACAVTGGDPAHVLAVVRATHPHDLQLHHRETLAQVAKVCRALRGTGVRVIKALRVGPDGRCDFEIPDPAGAARALAGAGVSALLVDSHAPGRPGGTGLQVDPAVFRAVREAVGLPVILAGGLTPENLPGVLRAARPEAVDVLTGVEDGPGHKNGGKIREFLSAVSLFEGQSG